MNRLDAIADLESHAALRESKYFGAIVHAACGLSALLDNDCECEIQYQANGTALAVLVGDLRAIATPGELPDKPATEPIDDVEKLRIEHGAERLVDRILWLADQPRGDVQTELDALFPVAQRMMNTLQAVAVKTAPVETDVVTETARALSALQERVDAVERRNTVS